MLAQKITLESFERSKRALFEGEADQDARSVPLDYVRWPDVLGEVTFDIGSNGSSGTWKRSVDGIYVIRTSLAVEHLAAAETVQVYKNLSRAEPRLPIIVRLVRTIRQPRKPVSPNTVTVRSVVAAMVQIRQFLRDRKCGGPPAVSYCFIAGAPGSTAATPSGLMLKAKNINGSLPGFPHWCTRAYGS